MITVISPDRVVIGGGIAAAGDLLLGPDPRRAARRVHTTSLDEVEIVTGRARDLGRGDRGGRPRRRGGSERRRRLPPRASVGAR